MVTLEELVEVFDEAFCGCNSGYPNTMRCGIRAVLDRLEDEAGRKWSPGCGMAGWLRCIAHPAKPERDEELAQLKTDALTATRAARAKLAELAVVLTRIDDYYKLQGGKR